MVTWVALFRGINVGGKNSLPMKQLVALLGREGFAGARTYIQSGNVVVRGATGTTKSLAKRIGQAVQEDCGFRPKVLVLTAKELQAAAASNPFPDAEAQPKTLHLFFLAEKPRSVDLASLNQFRAGKEAYALKGKIFYFYAPDGFGTSKLAANVERLLHVDATARNWRTISALLSMIKE